MEDENVPLLKGRTAPLFGVQSSKKTTGRQTTVNKPSAPINVSHNYAATIDGCAHNIRKLLALLQQQIAASWTIHFLQRKTRELIIQPR